MAALLRIRRAERSRVRRVKKTMGKVFGKVVDHERDVAEALGDVGSEAFYRKILPSEGEFYALHVLPPHTEVAHILFASKPV